MDAVKVLNREYADNPYVFEDDPSWLLIALKAGEIKTEFRSEDYWYYVVRTPSGLKDATPGDLIVHLADGSLDVFVRKDN